MSQMMKHDLSTQTHLPPLLRSRALDYTLLIIGAIVAAFGVYAYYAPTDWVWADLAEGWYLGSFVVGGALLTAGFGFLGAGMRDHDGFWSTRAVSAFVAAGAALIGAVIFAAIWIV